MLCVSAWMYLTSIPKPLKEIRKNFHVLERHIPLIDTHSSCLRKNALLSSPWDIRQVTISGLRIQDWFFPPQMCAFYYKNFSPFAFETFQCHLVVFQICRSRDPRINLCHLFPAKVSWLTFAQAAVTCTTEELGRKAHTGYAWLCLQGCADLPSRILDLLRQ